MSRVMHSGWRVRVSLFALILGLWLLPWAWASSKAQGPVRDAGTTPDESASQPSRQAPRAQPPRRRLRPGEAPPAGTPMRFDHRLRTHKAEPCQSCHVVPNPDEAPKVIDRRVPVAADTCFGCHTSVVHDQDFSIRHRWVAADEGALCASCHKERACVACHEAPKRFVQRPHPAHFLSTHGAQAGRDETQCSTCHQPERFCAECHARLGMSRQSAPLVRTRARVHPEQWASGAQLHGDEARRALTACVSCHQERDCVACHGVRGVGAGFSPHPPNFRAQCGDLRRANARACRTCHGSDSRLMTLCE